MSDRIIAVTPPDDILQDGNRILTVDLTENQMSILSQALNQLEEFPNIIFYIWKSWEDTEWLLDKKHKSNLIIFNAESENHMITGYMSAQPNSYYFGILKNLNGINNNAIYDVVQMVEILERKLK